MRTTARVRATGCAIGCERRAAPNLVSQGITTVVVNQDGRSPWPVAEQRALLEKKGIGVNALLLVGHGTVRRRAMGDDTRRPARAEEIAKMRALVNRRCRKARSDCPRVSSTSRADGARPMKSSNSRRSCRRSTASTSRTNAVKAAIRCGTCPARMAHGADAARRRERDDRDRREDWCARRGVAPQIEGRTLLGIERRGDQVDSTRS